MKNPEAGAGDDDGGVPLSYGMRGGGTGKQQAPLRLARFGMAKILVMGRKPFQTAGRVASGTRRLAAADVRCLEAFRPLQQVELDGLALVKSAIAVFLDGGKVDENIFTR